MPPRLGSRRRARDDPARFDRDGIAELYARDSTARLIVVVASEESAHDSGSVAVAIARNWAEHGREVLMVDADASGSTLARRLGEATRANYSPATRGLPSLMAARQHLTAELLRDHCWRLSVPGQGAVWLLLGPTSASGAPLAATWLADCAAGLIDANAGRNLIVSMTAPLAPGPQTFLRAASAVVLVAPADTDERFELLRALGSSLLATTDHCSPCLVIDGAADRSYDEIRTASGLHVAGQLDGVSEHVLLRTRPRRRDVKATRLVEELAARIAFLATEVGPERQDQEAPEHRRVPVAASADAWNSGQADTDSTFGSLDKPNGIRTTMAADQ